MLAPLYPVHFAVDYPDHLLDRMTTGFRLILAIPIVLVVGAVSASTYTTNNHGTPATVLVGAGGMLFFGQLLMIVFRQKYPRWSSLSR